MRSSLRLGLLCALLSPGACADFHRGAAPDAAPDAPPLVDDPTFENNVHPLLLNMCLQCHSPGNQAQNTRYKLTQNAKADRPMVIELVDVVDPESSVLLRKGRGESHEGGVRLPADGLEYPTVRDWIAGLATKKP
jgi:hypothetical protein